MKVVYLKQAGGVDNLYLSEKEMPSIESHEVLVEVRAISLNPADVKAKTSDEMLSMMFGPERPVILGWDIAGVVSEVGTDVQKWCVGDRVFGMVNFPGVGNAYAEYVASPEDHLAKIPEDTSFEEAAATTLAALTALQMMKDRVKVGDRVLVHGGSGGVGHYGIQIAKAMGAHVITTASGKNTDFVKSIGADEPIDYRTKDFEEECSDIDFVLDVFGESSIIKSVQVVKKGGMVISTLLMELSENLKTLSESAGVHIAGLLVKSDAEDMNTLADMLSKGQIKPAIHMTFAFEEMRQAHLCVENGGLVGKVIVTL